MDSEVKTPVHSPRSKTVPNAPKKVRKTLFTKFQISEDQFATTLVVQTGLKV